MNCRDAEAPHAHLGRRNANAGPNSSGNRFSNAPEVFAPGQRASSGCCGGYCRRVPRTRFSGAATSPVRPTAQYV